MKRLLMSCFLKERRFYCHRSILRNICIAVIVSFSLVIASVRVAGAACCKGDIDNSGGIELQDAIISLQIAAGVNVAAPVSPSAAVINNGKIGLAEAIYILQRCADLRPANCISGNIDIFILNTGDIHEVSAKLSKIVLYVKAARQENPNRVVLLDAGDMLLHRKKGPELKDVKGKVVAVSDWKGQHDKMYEWASLMNYDAMVFGNHDFEDTVQSTLYLITKYSLPFICANLKHDKLSVPEYKIIPLHINLDCGTITVKIGVIGLADQIKKDYHDRSEAEKEELKIYRAANDYIKKLIKKVEKESDFLVFLSHNEDAVDRLLLADLRGNKKYIVVGGHSHQEIPEPPKVDVDGEILIKSGAYGKDVGSTMVTWDPNSGKIVKVTQQNILMK